jgi:hypothetical protein
LSEEGIKQFTEKDFELIEAASIDILNNPDSDFTGTIKPVSINTREEDFSTIDCRSLQMEVYKNGERIKTTNRTFLQ